MVQILRRKILLVILLISFLISLYRMPTASAYGITIDNPELILPGDFEETLSSIHESAYYKIYCATGGNLTVNITFLTISRLWIYIYNPNKWEVATAWELATSQQVIYQPQVFGYFIIRIYRNGAAGDDPFNMTVSWTGGLGIPAFELPFILYGFALTIGIILLFRKRLTPL